MTIVSLTESNSAIRGAGKGLCKVLALAIIVASACLPMAAQVSVTTWRNDIGRTGQNLNETILTPANVNATQFGKLFSQPVDGYVYAQPLYVPNVTIGGQSHNVVYVATENDSVYAFDADSNGGTNSSPLWFASMLSTAHGAAAGATTVSSNDVGTDIVPQVGITGTPVIDPSSGTLYVVSATEEGTTFYLRLHALDITSGAEKFGGPKVITATIPGTGTGSSGGMLTFDPEWENQRPGLLLLNGIVYVAFASHGDNGPWHGWIFSYKASSLQQTSVFCTSPNGTGSGIWMSGAGLAADVVDPVNHPYGRMFIANGNGDFTAAKPYTSAMDFGDSILNLDLTNGVPTVQDTFTPFNQAQLDEGDGDTGSGGVMIVPTQTTGNYPNLLIQSGKSGTLYNLDRDNLGGYNTGGDQVVQNLPYTIGNNGSWTTPAYWNGNVYYWGVNNTLKEFSLTNGLLSGPTATSSESYGYPGANPVISANGNTNGIVWSLETDEYSSNGPEFLQAHNATTPGTTLYSSASNATRDNAGAAVKFAVPTVVNGKVYVGSETQLSVYGLLGSQTLAATPVMTPGTESFSGTLSVTITDSTAGSTIYYTTDGSTPSATSAVYTKAISISATTVVKAIAGAPNYDLSAVATATYTDMAQVALPVISPASGTVTAAFSATITDATSGSTIYYTTNGSTPTTSSTKYTGAIAVTASETLSAIAVASGYSNSNVASAVYTFSPTGVSFPSGFASSQSTLILNGSTGLDDSRLQITNGALNEAGSAWYYQPVNVQAFTTEFSFQLSNPAGNGITFAIQGNGTSALGSTGSGLGYAGIAKSLAIKFDFNTSVGSGTDSTGLYQNGATPTVPAIDLSNSGINLLSDDTMDVKVTYNGTILSMSITDLVTGAAYTTSWTVNIPSLVGGSTAYVGFTGGSGTSSSSQKILTWTYSTGSTALPLTTSPSFSPAGGSFTAAQTVTMTSLTSGASIYYTTNGTAPTTSSTLYTAPVTVASTETLEAIAVASGYASSAAASAAYTIAPSLPTPTFSPAAGVYATAQTVTINEATAGSTIYYTTNGTTPTTSSAVYSGSIAVNGSETVKAIAVETGYSNSAIATGIYTISSVLATPSFSPAAGTYTSAQLVTISSTAGATIHYTTNGTTPTAASAVYTGPIAVDWTQTLQAIAVEAGDTNSAVGTAAYAVNISGTSYINYPAGGFTANNLVLNYGPTVTGGLLQMTDGGDGEIRSAWYNAEVPVGSFVTDFTFQQTNATADGMTFAIQGDNIYELGYSGGGLGYQNIPNSVAVKFDLYSNAGEGSDSTGLYTDGVAPTVPSVDLSSTGINLHSGDLMHAHMVYDGTNLTMLLTDTTTNASVTEVFPVNIPSVVGSSTAYVGFTGATGAAGAVQNVLSWSYETPSQQTAAAPTFSPAAGSYTAAQQVTISSTTSGATIYYTTNGTMPTTSSSVYSAPITVGASETVEAIAVKSGDGNSSAASAVYTITTPLPAPSFSVAGGTYSTAQTVTISDATAGATFYYTTNGTLPTTSSTLYTGAITVSATETLEAIAVKSGYTNSAAAVAAYTIGPAALPAPALSLAGGTYNSAQTVTITDSVAGAAIYITINGTTPTASSTRYSGPVTIGNSETLSAIAIATGYTNSAVTSAAYTLVDSPPVLTPAAGSYTGAQTVTMTSGSPTAKIFYTTNGTTPSASSTAYTGPITVSATETVKAIAAQTGFTSSSVVSAAYTITAVAPTPTFSVAGGTYTTAQTVTLADTLVGTTIYYTTNGTTPTTASTVYSAAITVSGSETVEAIAVKSGYANSAVATAVYTIAPLLPAPTFSVAAGTYSAAQSVALSDTNAGAKIYYTTNGTMPTTSSTLYTSGSPIAVSATETITAIAAETGYTTSSVATAVYTITSASTTYINYPSGGIAATNFSLNYGATVAGGLLQLTDGGSNENRSAWYTTAVPVTNFTTDFTFQQLNATGDGMTFTIQNSSIWALGGSGGGLGYQGIPNSVAVKFDLYDNGGEGVDSTGIYSGGAMPTLPSIDLSSTGINLHSAHIMHAHMVYNGTTLTMTLTDTVTSATVTEVFTVNIPSLVGGNTAYVGFTGGSGAFSATQNVLSWTYTSP